MRRQYQVSHGGPERSNRIVAFDDSPRHCGGLLDVKIQHAGTFTFYCDLKHKDPSGPIQEASCVGVGDSLVAAGEPKCRRRGRLRSSH
jgi:hypothetical protein